MPILIGLVNPSAELDCIELDIVDLTPRRGSLSRDCLVRNGTMGSLMTESAKGNICHPRIDDHKHLIIMNFFCLNPIKHPST